MVLEWELLTVEEEILGNWKSQPCEAQPSTGTPLDATMQNTLPPLNRNGEILIALL
jgi:hypothetical protein